MAHVATEERHAAVLRSDVATRRTLGSLGDQVHRAADRVGVHVGGERLRHLDRREHVRRDVVQLHDPVAFLGSRDVYAIDGDVRQAGLGAADLHELPFALVPLERYVGHAARGLRRIAVGKRADLVPRQDGHEVVRDLLAIERGAFGLAQAMGHHEHALQTHGQWPEAYARRGGRAAGHRHAGGLRRETEQPYAQRVRSRWDVVDAE